jgi:peptidoglycan/LPS O-acetylase OafA/YrhL
LLRREDNHSLPKLTSDPNPGIKSGEHIGFLDTFRGFAILIVFLFHSLGVSFGYDNLPWNGLVRDYSQSSTMTALLPLTYGRIGVAIFFAVSGFCIHLSFQKHQASGFKTFFIRRFWRIYPPYLAAILFFALVFPALRINFTAASWPDLLIHALALQNFFSNSFYTINPSFWSIAIEIQLYLLYPLLLLLVSRLGWTRTIALLALVEITIRALMGASQIYSVKPLPIWFTQMPLAYWLSWSLGAWLADTWLNARSQPVSRLSLAFCLFLVVISNQIKFLEPLTFTFTALFTVVLMARLLEKKMRLPDCSHFVVRYLKWMGVWSYSLYLLHQPFLMILLWLRLRGVAGVGVPPLVTFVICLLLWLIIAPISITFYRWVELPSIALGRRLLAKSVPA